MTLLHELHQLAAKPDLTLKEYLSFVRKNKLSGEAVDSLQHRKRWELLEQLKDHRQFGKRARDELRIKEMLDKGAAEWEKKVSKYPKIIKEMRQPLIACKKSLYDINFPSETALRLGAGSDYFAVMHDGFLSFLFEVVSLKDRGKFRLIPRPISAESPKYREYSDSIAFRAFANCSFGDILTGDQVIEGFEKVYHSGV